MPGASSIPAADSNHTRMAIDSGKRIVEMVWEDLTPAAILTMPAFRNAITVDMAIGGSTNAIIHLVALARRCGLDLPLRVFDEIAPRVPVLANIRPSGEFLMEDFYYAGGLRALMAEIRDLLELDCLTVNREGLLRACHAGLDPGDELQLGVGQALVPGADHHEVPPVLADEKQGLRDLAHRDTQLLGGKDGGGRAARGELRRRKAVGREDGADFLRYRSGPIYGRTAHPSTWASPGLI